MTSVRKIYIDSRYRNDPLYSSNSDFAVTLPRSLEVPENYVGLVSEVSLSNTLPTIQHGVSDLLYLQEENGIGQQIYTKCTVSPGYYTAVELATEIQRVLNLYGHVGGNPFVVSYDATIGKLHITHASVKFRIWTRQMLRYGYLGATWGGTGGNALDDPLRTRDCYEAIGMVMGVMALQTIGVTFTCLEYTDVSPIKCLFLTSPDLGLYTSITPTGTDNVIRRIDVTSGWGTQIISQLASVFEYIEIGGQQLSTLHFRLVDSHGNLADLRGRPISFSILLVPRDMV